MFLIEFDTARSGLILRQHRATACTELLRLGFGKYRYMFDEVLMKISCRFVIKSFTVRPKEGRGSPQHISQHMQKHKHNLPSLPKIQNMSKHQIVFIPRSDASKLKNPRIQISQYPNHIKWGGEGGRTFGRNSKVLNKKSPSRETRQRKKISFSKWMPQAAATGHNGNGHDSKVRATVDSFLLRNPGGSIWQRPYTYTIALVRSYSELACGGASACLWRAFHFSRIRNYSRKRCADAAEPQN